MKRTETHNRVVLVTGSDRGIGFEVCREMNERGYRVVLTSPVRKQAVQALTRLPAPSNAVTHALDVASPRSVLALRKFIMSRFGRLDILVNNAGVLLDEGRSKIEGIIAHRLKRIPKRVEFGEGPSVLRQDIDIFRATLEINTFGALRMCQAFVPLMMEAGYGRVVNLASGRGQLDGMTDEGAPAYQLSKTALNAITVMVADAARGANVLVNSVCPGWTRTDLGGPEAPRSVEEAADTIVWLATLPNKGPTGRFFRNRKPIPW